MTITSMTLSAVVIRPVTRKECPWLEEDIPAGKLVFIAPDNYNVCSDQGVLVETSGHVGAVELPKDSLLGIVED